MTLPPPTTTKPGEYMLVSIKSFQNIDIPKQKLLLWVSLFTLTSMTSDHRVNRSSRGIPRFTAKPHKNATFRSVESRPGVCFRIGPYSKETQKKVLNPKRERKRRFCLSGGFKSQQCRQLLTGPLISGPPQTKSGPHQKGEVAPVH